MKRTIGQVWLTGGLFLALAAVAALADGRGLVPVLVGGPIDVSTGETTNMGNATVAYNSIDHEFRIAWFDSRIAGQNDVYAQRVGTDGALLGDNVAIITGPASETGTSLVFSPANNRYFVTWCNQNGNPGSPGFNHTYGGLASATGGLISPAFDVSNGGLEATLAYNSAGNEYFLEARNFAGGGAAGIYGQRVSGAGTLLGPSLTIATAGAPAPAGQVAYDSHLSRYLATWRDQEASNLKGRLINADGTFATAPFVISSMFPESELAASVGFDNVNYRYLTVFSEFCAGSVYGQFVANDGTLIGPTFTIATSSARLLPFLAFDPVYAAYLAAWTNIDTQEVQAQLVAADGSLLGDVLTIAHGPVVGGPRLTADTAAGGFIVTWTDWSEYPDRADIFAQRVGVQNESVAGDLNCDGAVNNFDITPFVLALTATPPDYPEYYAQYGECDHTLADINGDGAVNNFDITPFVELLTEP